MVMGMLHQPRSPLLLPNGHVLHQIAPLTPEQLAELAQNTQLKNQLYAQLLYRSMAQTAPGQPPIAAAATVKSVAAAAAGAARPAAAYHDGAPRACLQGTSFRTCS